ncbi:MAG: putative metal-binding protein [Desulfotomaculum sp. 46_296]|nr:MAG: putative metal-binding protein [Desulfotomaculum sp. 46_296]
MTCELEDSLVRNVKIIPWGKVVAIPAGENLLQAIAEAEIPVRAACGGEGACSRCKVLLKEGRVSPGSPGGLTGEELASGYVLACQSIPVEDVVIEIPADSLMDWRRVVLAGPGQGINPSEPLFRKTELKLSRPSLDDPKDDLGRLLDELSFQLGNDRIKAGLGVLRSLPVILRESGWVVNVSLAEAGGETFIEQIEPLSESKYYGLAVDIGTTTIAACLVDLGSGQPAAVRGAYNKQSVFGEDVISRIVYAEEHKDGLGDLQGAVLGTINGLISGMLDDLRVVPDDVRVAVCAGNTTMTHLFLGLNPAFIRLEPYVPVANNPPPGRAGKIGLKINPGAWVHCLPGISSYIGGDITAGVLVTGMAEREETALFIDVGTNGEMVLGNREWLVACSCSAGPAFEGNGIRCGMPAAQGAIERVFISEKGLKTECRTVGNAPPAGICGSGLIDCLACFYREGIIDRAGKFIIKPDSLRIREGDEGPEFILAHGLKNREITISETEIKNLIRSKAAVFAGIRSMLKTVGLPVEAIERIYLAGGFGRFLNIRQAVAIGMLPDLPEDRYAYLGNSSVKGAVQVLLSKSARRSLKELSGRITYLELAADKSFYDEFVSALFLPHTDLSLFPSVNFQ